MQKWDVVVVGAGIAGVSAARTAAERGSGVSVLLLNGEPVEPYRRTKVSKYIAEGFDPGQWQLQDVDWYRQLGIDLRTGVTATALEPDQRQIQLSDGSTIGYGKLILATGSTPRFPPVIRAHEEGAFFVVRSTEDVQRLTKSAKRAKRVLVAGMGVLGVEVAEQLRKMKKQVIMVGTAAQVMPRQLNARAAEILEDLLRGGGVRLHFQEEILSFEARGKGGFAVSMIRESGVFDMIVLCIGVRPRKELAEAAGLTVNDGVVVDEYLRAGAPDVFAAGDVAEHPGGLVTGLWHSAEHQGEVAARNALGEDVVAQPGTFRLKCEVFGAYFFSIAKPANELAYELDEIETGDRYRCLYFDDDLLVGAVMVNDKDRAKVYEQAVRERRPRERVEQDLPF
jgi:NAD(P)H-nitrite reductase large subunit